jgi:hypothetical protein
MECRLGANSPEEIMSVFTDRQKAVANLFRFEVSQNDDGTFARSAMTGNGDGCKSADDAEQAFLATLKTDPVKHGFDTFMPWSLNRSPLGPKA